MLGCGFETGVGVDGYGVESCGQEDSGGHGVERLGGMDRIGLD